MARPKKPVAFPKQINENYLGQLDPDEPIDIVVRNALADNTHFFGRNIDISTYL